MKEIIKVRLWKHLPLFPQFCVLLPEVGDEQLQFFRVVLVDM
jgi:hypothetical protein